MHTLPRDVIRHLALNSGLELKLQPDGSKDLRKYMFVFADAVTKRVLETPDGLTYFPALFDYDEEGFYTITFRDIPECISQGGSFKQAIEYATDALETCKDFYIGRDFPNPSFPVNGEVMIGVKL